MMKKLLIFMLVLGLASVASATISLQIGGSDVGTTVDLLIGDVIQIYSSDSSAWLGYVFIADASQAGTLINPVILTPAGDDATITPVDYTGSFGVGYTLGADGDVVEPTAGVQFEADFTAVTADIGKTGVINVFVDPEYGTPADSTAYTIIPEPMTVLLLGLGGLFLRRRKK